VLRATRQRSTTDVPAPRLVMLSGGKGGVGVTTTAVNLAVALADQAVRVVLVDGDLYRADVATLCQLEERGHVGDLLSGKQSIHEVLQAGPGGIQVVPGIWAPDREPTLDGAGQQRLIKQIRSLGPHADMVLLDIGSAGTAAAQRYWLAADEAVVITTPDSVAIMDSYATIKTALCDPSGAGSIWLLVNRGQSDEQAREVHQRIDRSARRFLGRAVGYLGWVPYDPHVPVAAGQATPLILAERESDAARAIGRVATRLIRAPAAATRPRRAA
jgi:flagellar biosynthesis protein FlhG